MLEIYGKTDRGNVRENNEDRICYPRPDTTSPRSNPHAGQLLIVADGVGGAQGGEHASRLTVETIKRAYYYGDHTQDPRLLLRRAIETANHEVLTRTSSVPALRGAASTVTAAAIKGDQLYVANVGDSRTYLIQANGRSEQLTRDHSLTQQKIDKGILRPDQAKTDADSHVITRSVGLDPNIEVDIFPPSFAPSSYISLAPGDRVLLCSDGLTDLIPDEEIARIAARNSPQKAVNQLIKLAKRNGGHDNISIIIGRVPGDSEPAQSGRLRNVLPISVTNPKLWLTASTLVVLVIIGLALRSVWPDQSHLGNSATTSAIRTSSLPPTATMTAAIVATLALTPTLNTPANAVAPTATRIATRNATSVSPTDTPRPSASPVNTSLPTPTPPSVPTVGNQVTIAPPELVAPSSGDSVTASVKTDFAWKWPGSLASNQGFEILLWPHGKPDEKKGVHDAKETVNLNPDAGGAYHFSVNVFDRGQGDYEWTVAIVQLTPYQRIVEAPPRQIKISSSSPGGDGAAGTRP